MMRTYGCIGFPLAHSHSKKYFEEKFARKGITDARFMNYEIEDIHDLPGIIKADLTLRGLSVTTPHKTNVIPLLDELDESAGKVGAVNCIKISGKQGTGSRRLTGYNTDVYGFAEAIHPHLKKHHRLSLVLGTGGAAMAVGTALNELGVDPCWVSREMGGKKPIHVTYDMLRKTGLRQVQVIVNATPLGMYPKVDACPPIPYESLTAKHLLFDLIYNPTETLFLKKGHEMGATVANGQKMLELQAEKSWEIWNGADS